MFTIALVLQYLPGYGNVKLLFSSHSYPNFFIVPYESINLQNIILLYEISIITRSVGFNLCTVHTPSIASTALVTYTMCPKAKSIEEWQRLSTNWTEHPTPEKLRINRYFSECRRVRPPSTQFTSWPPLKLHQPFKVSPPRHNISSFVSHFLCWQAWESQVPASGRLFTAGTLPLPQAWLGHQPRSALPRLLHHHGTHLHLQAAGALLGAPRLPLLHPPLLQGHRGWGGAGGEHEGSGQRKDVQESRMPVSEDEGLSRPQCCSQRPSTCYKTLVIHWGSQIAVVGQSSFSNSPWISRPNCGKDQQVQSKQSYQISI